MPAPPAVTSAIQYFLEHNSPNSADLAALYNPGMECQVNVSRANGEPVEGRRNTYEDGETRWWNIRIPKSADKEPHFKDYPLTFDLAKYAQAIGMSGWNWQERRSYFVGYDFDSIAGHAPGVGITDEELDRVREAVQGIPWIETRHSTGGSGLHLYVHFENPPETTTHTEHAALARAVLGVMGKESVFDLASSMDVCGNIIWCWRNDVQEPGHQGLKIIKAATEKFTKVPVNWKDNIAVISKRQRHIKIQGLIGHEKEETPFQELTQARKRTPLEDAHKSVMSDLENSGYSTIWVSDHWLLQTHTVALKELAAKYTNEGRSLKGFFDTLSSGAHPSEPNCFMFPIKHGGWRVFRFGIGAVEAETWEQSASGWTQCYFNQDPVLSEAARALGGVEDGDKPGTFVFPTGTAALEAVRVMGRKVEIPEVMKDRQTSLKMNKGNRIHIKIEREKSDEANGLKVPGWLAKKGCWTTLEAVNTPSVDISQEHYEHDNFIRFCWQDKNEQGWSIFTDGHWKQFRKDNARNSFKGLGYNGPETERLLGDAVNDGWNLTTVPFAPEYPGGRQWNRFAPQWTYQPANLSIDEEPYHPHWDSVLGHCGYELDQALKSNTWAQKNGIHTGCDYLRMWVASAIREPQHHLPYLFLWGPQNSGKTILGDALSLLVTGGVKSANHAITSSGGFNSELAGVVFALIEELDLREASGKYYNRVKDWVTSETFMSHKKGQEPYVIRNYLKLIHTANNRNFSPIFPGDSRITAINVPPLPLDADGNSTEIPKPMLLKKLAEEASHFMTTILRTILPEMTTRLRIPVVTTSSKQQMAAAAMDPFQLFLAEHCHHYPGKMVPYNVFKETFEASVSSIERASWSSAKIKRSITFPYMLGFGGKQQIMCVGNISMKPVPEDINVAQMPGYILDNGTLIMEDEL